VKLRANTEKTKRTHALVTQGRLYVVGIGVFGLLVPALLDGLHTILGGLPSVAHTLAYI
jgi:hypothetical protein